VSSHLARQEVQLELDLPPAASGHAPDPDDPTRRVVVNLFGEPGESPSIMVGGSLLSPEQLAELVAYESRQSAGQLEVRIRADRRSPYGRVEPILLACARAGVWKVTFAVVAER